jgi:uncharacterized protein YegP (UPF0339 family)
VGHDSLKLLGIATLMTLGAVSANHAAEYLSSAELGDLLAEAPMLCFDVDSAQGKCRYVVLVGAPEQGRVTFTSFEMTTIGGADYKVVDTRVAINDANGFCADIGVPGAGVKLYSGGDRYAALGEADELVTDPKVADAYVRQITDSMGEYGGLPGETICSKYRLINTDKKGHYLIEDNFLNGELWFTSEVYTTTQFADPAKTQVKQFPLQ